MSKERDLRKRTLHFAVAVSGYSRGRSKPDFISKLGVVIEEADESDFWLEFSVASRLVKAGPEEALRVEANELAAIFTQSQKTAKANIGRTS